MREAIKDIERLRHILEQIDTLTNDLPALRPFIVKYIEELK